MNRMRMWFAIAAVAVLMTPVWIALIEENDEPGVYSSLSSVTPPGAGMSYPNPDQPPLFKAHRVPSITISLSPEQDSREFQRNYTVQVSGCDNADASEVAKVEATVRSLLNVLDRSEWDDKMSGDEIKDAAIDMHTSIYWLWGE